MKRSIVILHGWGLSGKTYAPLVTRLRKIGYRVYAPDLPGFGASAPPSYPWRLRDYVRFVHEYLTKHNIVQPVLIGHSFGGRISLKYNQFHPDNVSILILTGTPGFTPVPKRRLLLFVLLAKVGNILFSTPPLSLYKEAVQRWYYYVAGARDFFRAEGVMREVFKTIVNEELVTSMEVVSVPCLLIWGEYDIITPLSLAKRMRDVIPKTELVVIPEADHGVPFKQPEVFATYVERFVNSH